MGLMAREGHYVHGDIKKRKWVFISEHSVVEVVVVVDVPVQWVPLPKYPSWQRQ